VSRATFLGLGKKKVEAMVVETVSSAHDAAYAASADRDLRIITSRIEGDSTRRLTESYVRREVAHHAFRHQASVGDIQFWWPADKVCMALAALDWGANASHRAWLLARADAASLQWTHDPKAWRSAYHAIELEPDHVSILRECCAQLERVATRPHDTRSP
jgi:hypothetical protein